jgi:NAD-dependent SIR2 family protein deacetylase
MPIGVQIQTTGTDAMKNTIASLAEPVANAKEAVIFTGAGLSADSGIPTFRDGATGLWANIDLLAAASIEGTYRVAPCHALGQRSSLRRGTYPGPGLPVLR